MAVVRTYDTPGRLAEAAAGLTVESAAESARARGRFVWGLSGGTTPSMLYRLLAQPPYRDLMPWESTYVFWGDERWAPADSPESNQRMARELLLDHVPLPPDHIIGVDTSGDDPEASAASVESRLRELFGSRRPRPDLTLLGIGDDGHTASLFPGAGALTEQELLFTATRAGPLGVWRITATLPLINASRLALMLAQGASKARAVGVALGPEHAGLSLPAARVRPERGVLQWLIDREAASGYGVGEQDAAPEAAAD